MKAHIDRIAAVSPSVHTFLHLTCFLLLADTVGAPAVLRKTSKGMYWYAYGAYPSFGYESAPGADGLAYSSDGLHWTRAAPRAFVDTVVAHGAQPWEMHSVGGPGGVVPCTIVPALPTHTPYL